MVLNEEVDRLKKDKGLTESFRLQCEASLRASKYRGGENG